MVGIEPWSIQRYYLSPRDKKRSEAEQEMEKEGFMRLSSELRRYSEFYWIVVNALAVGCVVPVGEDRKRDAASPN